MADIIDPQTIAFCNDRVRPLADYLVGIKQAVDTEVTKWHSVINTDEHLAAYLDGDIVADGSAADGRTPLTKADVVNFVTQLIAFQALLDGVGVMNVVSKPHVVVRNPIG
jgi:hypothetical protein